MNKYVIENLEENLLSLRTKSVSKDSKDKMIYLLVVALDKSSLL